MSDPLAPAVAGTPGLAALIDIASDANTAYGMETEGSEEARAACDKAVAAEEEILARFAALAARLAASEENYWQVQAALSEIKLLVPLNETTDGPKAGSEGVVERVRCALAATAPEPSR